MDIEEALKSRMSARRFLSDEVDTGLIMRIIELATTSPSGSNTQPWEVHLLHGLPLKAVSSALLEAYRSKEPESPEYQYYPSPWFSPFIDRRRDTAWSLFGSLGIKKGDRASTFEQRSRNYCFFGAPVGLVFTIDSRLGIGSWLDYGAFLQSIMLAARKFGLHTCPQAAIANYPNVLREHLRIKENRTVVCGMALGYADLGAPENNLQLERVSVTDLVKRYS